MEPQIQHLLSSHYCFVKLPKKKTSNLFQLYACPCHLYLSFLPCRCAATSRSAQLAETSTKMDDNASARSTMLNQSGFNNSQEPTPSIQLIHANGDLDVDALERFVEDVQLAGRGQEYAVVSIMGPQSSGKSTLLNHLFGTKFEQMNAKEGRFQTTRGIWLGKATADLQACTLVLDIEGTDGKIRAEHDDTTFENQSALFALVFSDIVLINMWEKDIGLNNAANRPLLKTVFQAMVKSDSVGKTGKTTLLVVVRDYDAETPLHMLKEIVEEDIRHIWADVAKAQDQQGAQFSDYFNALEVEALPHFKASNDDFRREVESLRETHFQRTSLAKCKIPASDFSATAKSTWEDIKNNKDLALNDMLARARCDEIAQRILASLRYENEWKTVQERAQCRYDPELGKQLKKIVDGCLSEYDAGARNFNEVVRTLKRNELKSDLFWEVYSAYQNAIGNRRKELLDITKNGIYWHLAEQKDVALANLVKVIESTFDKECEDAAIEEAGWDASQIKDRFQTDVRDYIKLQKKKIEVQEEQILLSKKACAGIVQGILDSLRYKNEGWKELQERVKKTYVLGLGKFLRQLVDVYLSKYDAQASGSNEGVRNSKRIELESALFRIVYPAYDDAGDALRRQLLEVNKDNIHVLVQKKKIDDLELYVKKMVAIFAEECKDAGIKEAECDASKMIERFLGSIGAFIEERMKIEDWWDKCWTGAFVAGATVGVVIVAVKIAREGRLTADTRFIIGEVAALVAEWARQVFSSDLDEKTKGLVPVRGSYPRALDVGGTSALQQAAAKDSE